MLPPGFGPATRSWRKSVDGVCRQRAALTRAGLASALESLGIAAEDAARLWTVVEVETAGVTQGFGYREEAMVDSEDSQMMAAARFLVAEHIDEALRNMDWRAFAIGYNGVNYRQNKYDIRLAHQYERLAAGSLPDLEIRTAQAALHYLGYRPGIVDGVLGSRTKGALKRFRMTAGLPAGDTLDAATHEALCADAGLVGDH